MPNWTRLRYNLTTPMGKDGKRVTGNEEHIALAKSRRRVYGSIKEHGLHPSFC